MFELASPTAAHPVQRVSWFDAVLFCNWLSRREKRAVCYTRDESTKGEWTLVPDAERLPPSDRRGVGARLPSRDDDEYSFGDDSELLKEYDVVHSSSTAACGSKLPTPRTIRHAWNVLEWCVDQYNAKLRGGHSAKDGGFR